MVIWDENPYGMVTPVVVLSLIIINISAFLMTILVAPSLGYTPNYVIENLGLIPAEVLLGKKLYTLITSMFLHAGFMHIFGNMLYLYVFGDNVENALGKKNFIILYFLSGIGASIFHIATSTIIPISNAINSIDLIGVTPWEIPAVGASGAISGVLAAYYLLFPRAEIKTLTLIGPIPFVLRFPASLYILIWFGFQLINAILSLGAGVMAGVAFWAHIGGFLTGLALTPHLVNKENLRRLYMGYIYY